MTNRIPVLILLAIFFMAVFIPKSTTEFDVSIAPSKEDLTQDNKPYTPGTQSFIRGHHWFENITDASFAIDGDNYLNIDFNAGASDYFFNAKNIPLRYLVPRLNYKPKEELDDFDQFNLMLAEFSRNGISFPFAREGDQITHFQTNLKADIPWKLEDDFVFKPNPTFKPVRFSLVNNCLAPGLWEMNASDKTGEMYHGWFSFPDDQYYDIVSNVNNLNVEKAKEVLKWKSEGVMVDLDRLRTVKKVLGKENIDVVNEEISYSSQDSRRKLSKGFVLCEKENGQLEKPKSLTDMLDHKIKMAKFAPPGKYLIDEQMSFDFSYLGQPSGVTIKEVDPLTAYNFDTEEFKRDDLDYIEIEIDLPLNRKLIIGNLPLNLLVQKEDYGIHGFGVGIMHSSEFAERRQFLIEQGHHPSFAYIVEETPQGLKALNSHDEGLEQIFIRSFATAEDPYWDITFTSYERITDIVKYRVPILKNLQEQQIAHHEDYITPVYFSYRDDNLR